jgi:hypothetical protein
MIFEGFQAFFGCFAFISLVFFLAFFSDFACAKWLGPELKRHFGVCKNKVFC